MKIWDICSQLNLFSSQNLIWSWNKSILRKIDQFFALQKQACFWVNVSQNFLTLKACSDQTKPKGINTKIMSISFILYHIWTDWASGKANVTAWKSGLNITALEMAISVQGNKAVLGRPYLTIQGHGVLAPPWSSAASPPWESLIKDLFHAESLSDWNSALMSVKSQV